MENPELIKRNNYCNLPIPFTMCSSIFIDSTKFNKNILSGHYQQSKSTAPTPKNQKNILEVSEVRKINYNQLRKHKIFQNKPYNYNNKTRDRKKIFNDSNQSFKKQTISCVPINLKIYHYGRINSENVQKRGLISNHHIYPEQNYFHDSNKTITQSIIDKLDSRYYDKQSQIIIQKDQSTPLRKYSNEFYQNPPNFRNNRFSIQQPIFHQESFQQNNFFKTISPRNSTKNNIINNAQLDNNQDKDKQTHNSKKNNSLNSEIQMQNFSKNQNNCFATEQKQQKPNQRVSFLLISIFFSVSLMAIITLFS